MIAFQVIVVGEVLPDVPRHVVGGHVSILAGIGTCGQVLVRIGGALQGLRDISVLVLEALVVCHLPSADWHEHTERGGLDSRRHGSYAQVLGILLLEPVSVVVDVFVAGDSQGLWASIGLIIPLYRDEAIGGRIQAVRDPDVRLVTVHCVQGSDFGGCLLPSKHGVVVVGGRPLPPVEDRGYDAIDVEVALH